MPFLTKEKTNWKGILIVVILGLVVGGGILMYLKHFKHEIDLIYQFPEIEQVKLHEKIGETGESPIVIVKKFLDNYTKNPLGQHIEDLQPDFESEILKFPELSDSYKQVILKNLREKSFGYFGDPVLFVESGQTNTDWEIQKVETQKDKASVWINMKYGVANHKLKIDLLLINKQWKIDNVKWLKEEETSPEDVTNRALQVHMAHAVSSLWDNPDFSPSYKSEMKKIMEIELLHVDPVIYAQDTPHGLPIKVEKAEITNDKAYVIVNMWEKPYLKVELVLINGEWKIDNIVWIHQ
jgi:hypothetical protein